MHRPYYYDDDLLFFILLHKGMGITFSFRPFRARGDKKNIAGELMNLPDPIRQDIIKYAKRYRLAKVLLFGSRARGDNHPKSDIDLAVSGGDILPFTFAVNEEL